MPAFLHKIPDVSGKVEIAESASRPMTKKCELTVITRGVFDTLPYRLVPQLFQSENPFLWGKLKHCPIELSVSLQLENDVTKKHTSDGESLQLSRKKTEFRCILAAGKFQLFQWTMIAIGFVPTSDAQWKKKIKDELRNIAFWSQRLNKCHGHADVEDVLLHTKEKRTHAF